MILPLISPQSPEVLIFNIADVKVLREQHEILGVLIGTLAQYPQQNFFLSVPLKLFIYEVLWLVENGHGKLVDYLKWREFELLNLAKDDEPVLSKAVRSIADELDDVATKFSSSELKESIPDTASNQIITSDVNSDLPPSTIEPHKLTTSQLSSNPSPALSSTYQIQSPPNFIITPNSKDPVSLADSYDLKDYIANHLSKTSTSLHQFRLYYHNFKYLKSLGYFVNPGLKFGGDLVLYPGDPLKFHSYSIVKFHFVNLQELVVGGRLATGVKKNLIIIDDAITVDNTDSSSVDEEYVESLLAPTNKLAFSIQWAGFG